MKRSIRTALSFPHVAAALAIALTSVAAPCVMAQTSKVDIAVAREQIKAARMAYVADVMKFTADEGNAFWPLYGEYRTAMDRVADDLLKVVLKYADVYPNVPPEQARQLLKDYLSVEKKFVETQAEYLEKIANTITPARALLLVQLENRLDLALRSQLAEAVPLIPAPTK